ncbi:MAG: hypothetical protein O3A51_01030 [Verrucomicrobia bacterium]|nr:hypothetical protein [Verrucomicrobiota bacterium]
MTQYTSVKAHDYPLYYFIPSHTADGRHLVFHSERSGWVQLYRLDLQAGAITQLTDGRTRDAGWAVWCEPRLRGIYNHLSALNTVTNEVYYFADDRIWRTHVETLDHGVVGELNDRLPIGQAAFSPDGRHFAYIHTDRQLFRDAFADRESRINMGQWRPRDDHQPWRNGIACTVSLIDTTTGTAREVLELDYHVHHVVFLDDNTLLLNHPKNTNGMWTMSLEGSNIRQRRPENANGTSCHQSITAKGIYYETSGHRAEGRVVYVGRYDPTTDLYDEIQLNDVGYVHIGHDPAGHFLFYEDQRGDHHELASLHFPHDPARREQRTITKLAPAGKGQRFHAHPFLGPDRRRLFYTDVVDGFAHIHSIDVDDLVNLDEYWDAR